MTSRGALQAFRRLAGWGVGRRCVAAGVAAGLALGLAGELASVAAGAACGASGVLSGSMTLTCTYSTSGSDVFTVPVGVGSASFTVVGASGGHFFIDGDAKHPDPSGAITGRPGGAGGQTAATLSLTAGQVLQVDVAGRGADGTAAARSGGMAGGPTGGSGGLGGFGGSNRGVPGGPGDAAGASGGSTVTPGGDGGNGSGGGGASDVRFAAGGCAALTCPVASVLLLAAGGGGGGGTGGQGNALGGSGGGGGGAAGVRGGATVDGGNPGAPGGGATAVGGGAGGVDPARTATPGPGDPNPVNQSDPRYGGSGTAGVQGAGGAGGAGNAPCSGPGVPPLTPPCRGGPNSTGATSGGGAGGGGGGGLFGGGGGSGGGGLFGGNGGAGGGGGGGSSFAAPSASGAVLSAAVNCDSTTAIPCAPTINGGNGEVTITWSAPPPSGGVTSTTLSMSPPNPVTNQIVTLSATVVGGSGTPTGTVEFDDQQGAIGGCAGRPLTQAGTADCRLEVAAASSPYALTASFTPTSGSTWQGSMSTTGHLNVGLDATATAVRVSSGDVAAGSSLTYTATVTAADPGGAKPSGSVEFLDGAAAIPSCQSQPLTAGAGESSATCTLSYPGGGSHAITAKYGADANFSGSAATAPQTITVEPPPGGPPRASARPPARSTAGAVSVGRPRVHGGSVSTAVACAGATGVTCRVTVAMTIHETLSAGRLTAIGAAARRTTKRTVVVAARTLTLGAGRSSTVRLALNQTGRHLLSSRHRLAVTFTVSETRQDGGAAVVRRQTLSFRAPVRGKR